MYGKEHDRISKRYVSLVGFLSRDKNLLLIVEMHTSEIIGEIIRRNKTLYSTIYSLLLTLGFSDSARIFSIWIRIDALFSGSDRVDKRSVFTSPFSNRSGTV